MAHGIENLILIL